MSAPVRHTCPDIDNVIKEIRVAIKAAKDGQRLPDISEDAHRYFDDVETALWGLEEKMEDLRNDNSQLRHWAHSLEEVQKDFEKMIEKLETA